METQDIEKFITECHASLPHFEDGRIDYRTAEKAPVINIIVSYAGKVLLVKRSDKVWRIRESGTLLVDFWMKLGR